MLWAADDIKVTGAYTIAAIAALDTTTTADATTLNAIAVGPAADLVFDAAGTKALTVSRAAVNAASGLKIKLPSSVSSITSVTNSTTGYVFASGTNYTFDAATKILTHTMLPLANGTATFAIVTNSGTFNITLTTGD